MKRFFYFLFLFLVVVGLAVLGNRLRCMTTRGESCPTWCRAKQVQCLSSECELQLACQAPSWVEYKSLLNRLWEEQQSKWQTKK